KIDEKGIETQRGVVKEEKKLRLDNQPYGSILQEMYGHAYKVHPYNWVPIGSAQYIDMATMEEFLDFYKTFYVPNNATLTIAGDIDQKQTREWVTKYFGEIPKSLRLIPRPKVVEPEQKAEVRDTVYDNIQLPAVVMGYHIPGQAEPDFYAVSMLNQLLSQGESSRLQKEVKDKQQKSLYVGSFAIPTEDPGLAMMFGIVNMGVSPADLEAAIDAEVEKVQKELISEEEFQKLKNQVENDFIGSNSTMEGIAESLANYEVYYGDANLINTELDRYLKVTREDIKRVANKYFTKQNRVVLYYLPKEQ
ncbi:MAG TPA: pitrilysin family protein, partial [Flavobacteriales bacterium]|nr:pitrilysin family protein [Flavobacteriales bacterium]